MSVIDELLAANETYVGAQPDPDAGRPSRRVAIVTCMDVRVDPAAVLGLEVGEAHVIRNAGARVTEDVLRSLALSTHALGADTVVLMQHTRCGVAGSSEEQLRELTGASLHFGAIDDNATALREDLEVVATTPYLGLVEEAAALLYDVDTGRVDEIARWRRSGD